jgi:hypothetical protein
MALAFILLSACSSPSPTPSGAASGSDAASVSATPSQVTSERPSPTGLIGPQAARPYDAAAVLVAMQSSRRPGGVPAELQTDDIAGQLAAAVWTYDGTPWPTASASGSCGPQECTLDLSGTPQGAAGEDLYTFSITPSDGTITLLVADLHGYPAALDPALDALARGDLAAERLAGLTLAGARWLPPPRDGQFVLSYRSEGEEEIPALDVTLDLASGRVLDAEKPTT